MTPTYLDSGIGRTIKIKGKDYLYFSGTSYLGIGQDKLFLNSLSDNIHVFGANHGQSRINSIRLQVFDEFENFFARNAGAEAAAVLSSGYIAGIAAWKSLAKNAETLWIAPDAHPAIIPDELTAPIQFNFKQWKKHCLEQSEGLSSRRLLIIGNAVDPFTCEIHNYDWVRDIAQKHEVNLLIDDSHAFGTVGNSIYGTYKKWADSSYNLLVSGSLGKGLSLPAGIILGEESQILKIKATPLFGGASPGSPAHLKTFLDTENLYFKKKKWSEDACKIFAKETENILEIQGSKDFPVFVYADHSWVDEFEKVGILTSSFPYPTQNSPSVNRIVISAFHELQDLSFLIKIIQGLAK